MKKIFFALLSASMVLFAACQQEPSVKVSDGAEVLGYKPATYDIKVESEGSWTLKGDYDWITPSKTSGNSGETISFATTLNTTGLIRTADYTVVSNGDETTITLYQKSGKLDAVLSISVVEQGKGSASFDFNLVTSNSDDYAEYGVYYGTSDKFEESTRLACGTDMSAGIKRIELTNLDPEKDYYVWAYVSSLVGDEVVSSVIGVLPPVFVASADANFQAVINEARPYSEVRFRAGLKFNGKFKAKSNVKVSGGWNEDFSAQSNDKEDYLVLDAGGASCVMHIESNIQGFVLNRVKIANGNDLDGGGLKIDGKATIENCWFDNNYASHRGGAIGSTPDGGLDPGMSVYTVANSLFTRNGGIEHGTCFCVDYNCNGTFVNNLFVNNHGSHMDDYWHVFMTYAGGVFVNNTFVNNTQTCARPDYGLFGARHDYPIRAAYPLIFVNNIIIGNNTAEKAPGKLTFGQHPVPAMNHYRPMDFNAFYKRDEDVVANNLIEGEASNGFGDSCTAIAARTFGDTYSDFFVDYAGGNYMHAAAATTVNVGDTSHPTVSALLNTYSKDFAGNPRISGSQVDLGCYELQ
jgi:hypothetical protein